MKFWEETPKPKLFPSPETMVSVRQLHSQNIILSKVIAGTQWKLSGLLNSLTRMPVVLKVYLWT